jgi:soluble lytic murein transglycosylase-like protein
VPRSQGLSWRYSRRSSLIKRYRGSFALALAAYNSGTDSATAWWKRVGAEGLDVLSEEISIQETRGYVKRVLRTYGVYRWLYAHEVQGLAIAIAPANAPTSAGAP